MSSHGGMDPSLSGDAGDGALIRLLTGNWVVQLIYVTAKLGLPDLLSDRPRSAADLANATGAHERSLGRVLRALSRLGILEESESGDFGLTPMGQFLRSDVAGSLRGLALMCGEEQYTAWGRLLDCVKTGETAFKHAFDKTAFEHLAAHPGSAKTFDDAMSALSSRLAGSVVAGYDFSGFRKVTDLGGGTGTLLGKILQRHPQLHGVLFDRPFVVDRAREHLRELGILDRCEICPGDFFESLPRGSDAYVLSQVLFNWPDSDVVRLLSAVREIVPRTGVVLVIEQIVDRNKTQQLSVLMDLQMMAIHGGVVRTEDEYRALFERAGLKLVNRCALGPPLQASILEARPA